MMTLLLVESHQIDATSVAAKKRPFCRRFCSAPGEIRTPDLRFRRTTIGTAEVPETPVKSGFGAGYAGFAIVRICRKMPPISARSVRRALSSFGCSFRPQNRRLRGGRGGVGAGPLPAWTRTLGDPRGRVQIGLADGRVVGCGSRCRAPAPTSARRRGSAAPRSSASAGSRRRRGGPPSAPLARSGTQRSGAASASGRCPDAAASTAAGCSL